MSVDHYLKIGKGHKTCEDYILSGLMPCPYVVLADGCSSSKNTDIGARLLCHIAKTALEGGDRTSRNGFILDVADIAKSLIDNLSLPINCLDATIGIVKKDDNITFWGDGAIVMIGKSGHVYLYSIEYESGAPFYPSYYVDQFRKNLYIEKFLTPKIIKHYNFFDNKWSVLSEWKESPLLPTIIEFNPVLYRCIIISSDGIGSFIDMDGTGLDIKSVIEQLVAFKNINGAFLQRRAAKMIKNIEQQNIFHTDDISFGAIWLED